jgi:hypothetical protein
MRDASGPLMKKPIEEEYAVKDYLGSCTTAILSERRGKGRIYESFPINIRGIDKSGEAFELQTVTDNISATGLYIRMERPVEWGASLFMVINLSGSRGVEPGARVALRGKVRRIEWLSPDSYGIGVRISSHRFI